MDQGTIICIILAVTGVLAGYTFYLRKKLRDSLEESRKARESLQKARNLGSLGSLAGSIAHDFNNVLTAILGNIALAKMDAGAEGAMLEVLKGAEQASLRAKDLARRLLSLSGTGVAVNKASPAGEFIRDSVNLALHDTDIKCEFSIPGDLFLIKADRGDAGYMINNLVINAEQASPGGSVIEVSAENVAVSAEGGLPLEDGIYVKITIKDHGIGIHEEDLPRIFEPFFTTKHTGSGLGLSSALSMARSNNGCITAESEIGSGASFHIYLPAFRKDPAGQEEPKKAVITGRGRILVMDDEEMVRDIAGQMLERMGYEAEFTCDGAEAIRLYKQAMGSGRPFDAVIMDLTVPGGVGGRECIRELLKIDPGARVIVSSGYSNHLIMADFASYGFKGIVEKPYTIEEMSRVLDSVLKGAGRAGHA